MQLRIFCRNTLLANAIVWVAVGVGCQSIGPHRFDLAAVSAQEAADATTGQAAWEWPAGGSPEELAAQFFALAEKARQRDDPHSPDYFYQAAIQSWYCLPGAQQGSRQPSAVSIYHDSVAGLIAEGQRFGRFDGLGRLIIHQPGTTQVISLACLGLPWTPTEIGEIKVVGTPTTRGLSTYHTQPGFGVPVVVLRKTGCCRRRCERFLPAGFPFAATVILRPAGGGAPDGSLLEFYDPLKVNAVQVRGQTLVMARDISAPLALRLQLKDRASILGFLDPTLAERGDGLRFVEPYQAGKIPVVFVHGLLSDPRAWFDVANDLRAQPWFNESYQIWGFSYATGKPFITSAMEMRTQCREAVALLDPACQDPTLRQMVLVGHSMGGLVCKLQVTYSEERIWYSLANVPLDSLRAKAEIKAQLAERCFFDPQPFVRRVVLIATPHDGSSFAARGIGRLSSALVEPVPEAAAAHAELVADNPGAFSKTFERQVPTSVEMLEPQNATLRAIRTLRVSPCVKLHSIIGTGHPSLQGDPGDGVVPVASACHPGVESQRFVDATHSSILRDPEAHAELERILREHLSDSLR